MAGWNGSGSFTLTYSWVADAAAGIPITASRMDTQFADLSVLGFGNTLTRDGQGQPSANLPMNGYKHTGAAIAVASGEYLVYQQVVGGSLVASFSSVTTTGTITAGTGVRVTTGGATITAGGLLISAGGAEIHGTTNVIGSASVSVDLGVTGGLVVGGNVGVTGTVAVAGIMTAANGTSGTQVVNRSQFAATAGSPGTMTFPNGIIEKWGTGTCTAGSGNVPFVVAFPNSCDNVIVTIMGGAAPTSVHPLVVGAFNVNGFNVYTDAGEGPSFFWRAVGS